MLRHNVPVRRDLDQIAADNGFDFHIIDNEIYWDESRAYRFTLRQIEEQIEKPTAELHQMFSRETLPVVVIAESVGYASESSFHKAFVREFGCTPGEYRERVRQLAP